MAARDFQTPEARRRATAAVKAVEAETSAELVITLRRSSSAHLHAEYLAGFALSVVVLAGMLFSPPEFDLWSFPVAEVLAFVLGALACRASPALKRVLLTEAARAEAVRRAACEAFHDLGVTRTRGRTGILVYVSLLERRLEVVLDFGVDPKVEGLAAALEDLGRTVAAGPDLDRFIQGVEALGPVLGRALPRAADDVNELPDEVGPL